MNKSATLKNILIGSFVAIGILFVVWFLLFFRPHYGDRGEKLYVRFSSISNVGIGTPVTFAGRVVGKVEGITQIYNARSLPPDSAGNPYFFELELVVDSSVKVYNTDLIEIQTSGLLGEKSIAIIPKIPPKGVQPKLISDQVIYAESMDPLSATLNSVDHAASKIAILVEDIVEILDKNKDSITSIITSVKTSMQQISITLEEINKRDLVGAFDDAVTNIANLTSNVNQYVNEIRASDLLPKISQTASNLEMVTGKINDGTGTLGRLVNDPTIYLQVVATLDKMDTLMNDINHYGVFFHLDKGWKRTRLKRIHEMDELKTPKDFKTYFEKELSQVSLSLSRIEMLVEKSEDQNLDQDQQFKKAFLQLLQEVKQLQEIIELYNQKIINEEKG